jgi:hypothetical protein
LARVLADGAYDVFVVHAEARDDGALDLELTILSGDRKGEVVALQARNLGVDELEALGMPGTLLIAEGRPSLVLG